MRNTLLILFSIISLKSFAQSQLKDSIYSFSSVQIKPSFPGGITFFNQFVADNFELPNSPEFKGGKMFVDFVIDTTGIISDVRVLRDLGFGTADEAKRLFPTSDKWISGKQDGLKVKVRYTMPLVLPETIVQQSDQTVYDTKGIDQKPEYPGGIEFFYRCIAKNYKVPKQDGLKGKIFMSFVIETDGSITDIKIIRDIGYGTGPEARRVLKLCNNWSPGIKDGQPVRVLYSLPINIGGPN